MSDELLSRAERLAIDFGHRGNTDAADTIRDLLAEVEAQRKRGDEVIAVLRCLRDVCTTPGETKADFVERIKAVLGADPDARVESLYAAEAKLRELANAEPVAVVDREAVGRVFWLSIIPDGTQLIRRPEMPS